MFSSPSYAGWTKVSENAKGDTFYVDFGRIRKHDGYVYFWKLSDLFKPDKDGDLSIKSYNQVDCKLFRYKRLSYSFHNEPMGGGTGKPYTPTDKWIYPSPDSANEAILKSICSR